MSENISIAIKLQRRLRKIMIIKLCHFIIELYKFIVFNHWLLNLEARSGTVSA